MFNREASSRHVAVIAYTEYPRDPRVRREAEVLASDGSIVHVVSLRPRSGPSPSHLGGVHLREAPLLIRRGGLVRYLYQYLTFLVLSTAQLITLHRRRPLDLVHVHSLPDFQVFCALPLRLLGVPVLLDLHESTPELLQSRFHLSERSVVVRLAVAVQVLSCRFANHIIVACDGIREVLLARGLPAERITAVYNPGVEADGNSVAKDIRERLRLPDGPLLVHAGGINQERDLGTLLIAIARLPADSRISLVLAGNGERTYIETLRQIATSLDLEDRVIFVGGLSLEDSHALMALSEIGIVTLEESPHAHLAWPVRVREFVSLAKPIVVPRLRFLEKTIGDGALFYTAGDPVSLARQIAKALEGGPEIRQIVAEAGEVCDRLSAGGLKEILFRTAGTLIGKGA